MLLLLGSISVVLLDRTLKNNVDDSLKSIAHAMAESVKRPSLYGSDIEESLRSLLGPGLADRSIRLEDELQLAADLVVGHVTALGELGLQLPEIGLQLEVVFVDKVAHRGTENQIVGQSDGCE